MIYVHVPLICFFFDHIYSLTIRPWSWIPLTRIHITHSLFFLINFTPKLNVFFQNINPRQKYSVFLIISSILFKYAYLEYLIYNYKIFFFQYSTSPDTSVVLIPSIPLKKNKERIKALSWSRIIISKFCFHQQKNSKNLFSLEQVSWNSSWLVYSFNLL